MQTFIFAQYPSYFQYLWAFAWKPVLVYDALQEYDSVLWMDAGNLFRGGSGKHGRLFGAAECVGLFARRGAALNQEPFLVVGGLRASMRMA